MHFFSKIRRKSSITPTDASSKSVQADPTSIVKAQTLTVWRSSAAVQIRPEPPTNALFASTNPLFSRVNVHNLVGGLYHWTTCLFIVGLVCSQLLGAVWDSTTTVNHLIFGRSPLLGPYQIVGTNDIPYADRVVACVRNGNVYEPQLVSSLLAAPGVLAVLEDSSGSAIHGYRLKQRRVGSIADALDSAVQPKYESTCTLISHTIDNIFDACSALGYTNLTRDNLRVVDDWDSKNLYRLTNTLPILIMPYWDNAIYARHAIPTWEGDACIFRLEDAYFGGPEANSAKASFRGVNQSVRHERTIEWLGRPGGVWKNGWYEDLEGMRWYSDVKSSAKAAPYYMMHRLFDMRDEKEVDCSEPTDCEAVAHVEWWGEEFSSRDQGNNINSLYIANASEYGLFIYESYEKQTIRSVFDWETLLSNVSVGLVLIRWVLALVSLHVGAFRGRSKWFGGGIGCVSSAGSFTLLPVASLPRLKMTLAAFWTVGCRFEGQQIGLSESWFVVYPAIVHFVLVYYSLLNILAKAARRRFSDVLFTPTVFILCVMQYFRQELASSGWLKGVDGRVSTIIFSDELKKLQLVDYFTTDTAWRMNGRVTLLFAVKLGLLAVNLLPLLLARSFPISKRGDKQDLHGVEKALELQAKYVGGVGRSQAYIITVIDSKDRHLSTTRLSTSVIPSFRQSNQCDIVDSHRSRQFDHDTLVIPLVSTDQQARGPRMIDTMESANNSSDNKLRVSTSREIALVNSYELTRLGFLVFGDKYLITFDEWDLLSSMAPFRSFCYLWNHRVLVWKLRPEDASSDAELAGGRELESIQPQMWRLDDPRLQRIRWWQVSACSIQC